MIKRIIFDIDNTLIPWKDEWFNEISKVLYDLNINCEEKDVQQIKLAIGKYEDKYYSFNKELMMNFINEFTNKQYPIEFMCNLLDRWGEVCVQDKIEPEIIKTLEYLNSKYEMVVLTDWFAEEQINRLKKIDILKYFSCVYSAENTKRKPFKEAFMNAIGDNKPEECVMIGDSLVRDIEGALNAGLKAIHFTSSPKQEIQKYHTINKLEELINIL